MDYTYYIIIYLFIHITYRALIGHWSGTDRALIGHWSGTDRALIGHWSGTDRALIGHWLGTDRTSVGHYRELAWRSLFFCHLIILCLVNNNCKENFRDGSANHLLLCMDLSHMEENVIIIYNLHTLKIIIS